MLTVHILPPTHELIAHREEAIAAASSNIEEVMVIVDRGLVTAIHTPPVRGHSFESDDSWIRTAIAQAYRSGVQAGICSEQDCKPDNIVAPQGWVLWRNLKSGDIASSGGDFHGWVAISDDPAFIFNNKGVNARRFAHADLGGDVARDSNIHFAFEPNQRRHWQFYRVARRGLTGEQILTVLEAIEAADDTVQQVIDRVLPVGA